MRVIALAIDWKQIGTDILYALGIGSFAVACYGAGATINPAPAHLYDSQIRYSVASTMLGAAAILGIGLATYMMYLIAGGVKKRYTIQESRNISDERVANESV